MGFELDSPKGTLYSYLLLRASGNLLFNHIPDAGFWKSNPCLSASFLALSGD
jgi:hypothetical protein